MSVAIAAPNRMKIVPAFVVRKEEGVRKRTTYSFTKEGKRMEKVVEEPAGYIVSFPAKGHSIRVRNEHELRRLGFDKTIPLVNAGSDDDDEYGEMPNTAVA